MGIIKKLVIIGYGRRGEIYAGYTKKYAGKFEIVAVVEPNTLKRENALRDHNCHVYESAEAFFEAKIMADAAIISSQDENHLEHALLCLKAGYDILLEKPIACSLKDCLKIYRAQQKYKRKVIVCHVLRYTPFYRSIKEVLDKGVIGDIINIHASENVGYYHQAHSFVRGPWKNSAESTPMIVAKCCHDMDILRWLIGKKCQKIASFGGLKFFNKDNAPPGCADFCSDCKQMSCIYRAQDLYKKRYAMSGYFYFGEKDEDKMLEALKHTQYDRCVFNSGNDVVDHQTTVMEFKGGATAALTMTAFSKTIYRDIKIHGTYGELTGVMEDNCFEVRLFNGETLKFNTDVSGGYGGHGGGDKGLMDDLYTVLCGDAGEGISFLDVSIDSHIMAYSAEKARLSERVINLDYS